MEWVGIALLLLASYGIVYIYYQAIKFGYKMRTEKKPKYKETKRKSSKSSYNPYAICRSMQKRYNWTEEKYKRCIAKIQAKQQAEQQALLEWQDDAEDSDYGDLNLKED